MCRKKVLTTLAIALDSLTVGCRRLQGDLHACNPSSRDPYWSHRKDPISIWHCSGWQHRDALFWQLCVRRILSLRRMGTSTFYSLPQPFFKVFLAMLIYLRGLPVSWFLPETSCKRITHYLVYPHCLCWQGTVFIEFRRTLLTIVIRNIYLSQWFKFHPWA